jgi:hypothetical protein
MTDRKVLNRREFDDILRYSIKPVKIEDSILLHKRFYNLDFSNFTFINTVFIRSRFKYVNLSQAVHMTWGRFEPAVKRWEKIIGHPAPAPTEPTGKDGAPRLSSKFTEWMMGLEPGWITDVGLSRKDELKACGNGVVPQQAKLALTMLKARFEVE